MSNILFILTDQWPAWAFSYRGADIPTPNIDRLAAAGTVFDNAFTTCPLCTPARGTLLTARWPHQNGVRDNHAVGYSQQPSLSLDEATWIDEAVAHGYHVGYFGKWHLGPNNPEARGAHRYDPDRGGRPQALRPQTSTSPIRSRKERMIGARPFALIRGRSPFWGETATRRWKRHALPGDEQWRPTF